MSNSSKISDLQSAVTLDNAYIPIAQNGDNYKAPISLFSTRVGLGLNIKDYGAIGDGVTDDTAAINATFQAIRDLLFEVTETDPGYFVIIPYGKYRTTGPINATRIRNGVWGIKGFGGQIYADFNGGVVLDMIFSRFPHCSDFSIQTAPGKTPAIGILIGRETDNLFVADDHQWNNVHVEGTYSLACKFNYGSEDCASYNCMYLNDSSSTSAYCGVFDGSNRLGATSTFQSLASNIPTSFNSVIHRDTNWRRANGGPCLYMSKTDGHTFDGCFMATTSGHAVEFYTTAVLFNRNTRFLNTHIETTGMTSCFRFSGDASQVLSGFEYNDYNPFCSDQIFEAGSGITDITWIYPSVKITGIKNGVNPTNGVFSNASKFFFKKPDIRIYNNGSTVLELYDGTTLGASAIATAITGSATETVLGGPIRIYANALGKNGVLLINSYWTHTNSANVKTERVRIGTVGNGLTGSIYGQTSQTTTRSMRMQNELHNRNSTSSQVVMNGIGTGGWGTTINAASTDTRDTTVALDLVFTGQMDAAAAAASETIQLEYYTVQLLLP